MRAARARRAPLRIRVAALRRTWMAARLCVVTGLGWFVPGRRARHWLRLLQRGRGRVVRVRVRVRVLEQRHSIISICFRPAEVEAGRDESRRRAGRHLLQAVLFSW